MKFHDAVFGGIDGGKTELIWNGSYGDLFHNNGIVAHGFDNTL